MWWQGGSPLKAGRGGAAPAGTARPPAGKEPKVRVGFGRAGAALSSRPFDILPPSFFIPYARRSPHPPLLLTPALSARRLQRGMEGPGGEPHPPASGPIRTIFGAALTPGNPTSSRVPRRSPGLAGPDSRAHGGREQIFLR